MAVFYFDKPSIPSSFLGLSPPSSALSGGRPSPAPLFARSARNRPSIVFSLSVNGASHCRGSEHPFVLELMDVFSAFFDCGSDKTDILARLKIIKKKSRNNLLPNIHTMACSKYSSFVSWSCNTSGTMTTAASKVLPIKIQQVWNGKQFFHWLFVDEGWGSPTGTQHRTGGAQGWFNIA